VRFRQHAARYRNVPTSRHRIRSSHVKDGIKMQGHESTDTRMRRSAVASARLVLVCEVSRYFLGRLSVVDQTKPDEARR